MHILTQRPHAARSSTAFRTSESFLYAVLSYFIYIGWTWRHSNLWSHYDLYVMGQHGAAYCVKLNSNKIKSFGLGKCPYCRYLSKHVTSLYTNICQSLPTSWRKNMWHRYGMKKLRHCHPKTPFTRYSLLSNRLSNKLYNPVWQPCWTNSHCSFNRLSNRVLQPVWQPAVYTIQPVVKPVSQAVWQPVVSCKRGLLIHSCMRAAYKTVDNTVSVRCGWTQMNILGNVKEPFLGEDRFEVTFSMSPPRYGFHLFITGTYDYDIIRCI